MVAGTMADARLSPDGNWWWDGQIWVPTLSPDGRHRWDGDQWRALTVAPERSASATACSRLGCPLPAGMACSYVDQDGARCDTRWCVDHIRMFDGQAYCTRHEDVMRTLKSLEGSLHSFKRPRVGDRCLALTELIFEGIGPQVEQALRSVHGSTPGAQIVSDPHARAVYSGIELHWERSWAVLTSTGYLARVTLSLPSAEPPVVRVLVGKREVLAEMPDWVVHRLAGLPPEAGDREHFNVRLVDAIRAGLDRPVGFI